MKLFKEQDTSKDPDYHALGYNQGRTGAKQMNPYEEDSDAYYEFDEGYSDGHWDFHYDNDEDDEDEDYAA